jgi:hypothetical protein
MDNGRKSSIKLSFVACVSDAAVLTGNLMRSPCLSPGSIHQLILVHDCHNAAEGFNRGMTLAIGDILVFVHQDVFLPAGWDESFTAGFMSARSRMPAEVVGIYGLSAPTEDGKTRRLGSVNDRGEWLCGTDPLPARAQSLDELLIGVPRGSRLRPDPELGFDLYATDLVLQAESRGGCGAVVEAPCEHRSSLQRTQVPRPIIDRFLKAALVFERKWAARFPIETPCIRFDATGSAAVQVEEICKQINCDKSG